MLKQMLLTFLFSIALPHSHACLSPVLYHSVVEPKVVSALRHTFLVGDILVVRPGKLGGTSAEGADVLEKLATHGDAEYFRVAKPGVFKIVQEYSGKPSEAYTQTAKAPPTMRGGSCGDFRGK